MHMAADIHYITGTQCQWQCRQARACDVSCTLAGVGCYPATLHVHGLAKGHSAAHKEHMILTTAQCTQYHTATVRDTLL
jgi:hypothetical protein